MTGDVSNVNVCMIMNAPNTRRERSGDKSSAQNLLWPFFLGSPHSSFQETSISDYTHRPAHLQHGEAQRMIDGLKTWLVDWVIRTSWWTGRPAAARLFTTTHRLIAFASAAATRSDWQLHHSSLRIGGGVPRMHNLKSPLVRMQCHEWVYLWNQEYVRMYNLLCCQQICRTNFYHSGSATFNPPLKQQQQQQEQERDRQQC